MLIITLILTYILWIRNLKIHWSHCETWLWNFESRYTKIYQSCSDFDFSMNINLDLTHFLNWWCLSWFQLNPMDLNNTAKATKEILFFNRVPKVGSQTTMELLKSLSHKNQFTYHKDRTQKVETIKLTYNEEKWLANLVNYFEPPSVYVKHVCFVNFTQ